MKVEPHQPRRIEGRADRGGPPERTSDGTRQAQRAVQLGPLRDLTFRRQRLPAERFRDLYDLVPRGARDDEWRSRDRARVADLWIPLAAVEDRPPPELGELHGIQRFDGDPWRRHRAEAIAAYATAAIPRYSTAGTMPRRNSGARGRRGVGRARRSTTSAAPSMKISTGSAGAASTTVCVADSQLPATARP